MSDKKAQDLVVQTGAYGTKNINELLDLAEEGLDDTKAALSDGKITLLDLPKFVGVITKIGPALEGIDQVWPEVKDIQADEMTAVLVRVGVVMKKAAELFKPA